MDLWRRSYLLPAIASGKSIALIGIGDNEAYWSTSDLNSLATFWDPARLACYSKNYCIYDIDPDLVERARSRGIQTERKDVTTQVLTKQYDYIFASDVIEHVSDPLAFIINCRKSLHPAGSLILTTPNALYWRNFIVGFRYEHPEHRCCFGKVHIENLAKLAKLQVTNCVSFQSRGETPLYARFLYGIHSIFSALGRGNSLLACLQHPEIK